ncbi:hypothetical protein ASZ78_005425 [Callipepla squamata]|uniref:RING-type E3 ubiquitin transferase n=1 Tax=Callipepla squamata TaxID=9009 RepID=A0A226MIS4_CALSU|nr:hypothetical protein ASZ78_005425 [Callipepla squamata]
MTCNGPGSCDPGATPATDGNQEWAQEHCRLGTFVEFPCDCPVSASALARAGFVYTGEGDKVKCFSCHATVEGWQPGDSAIDRHKNLSPDCRFITESACLGNSVHPLVHSHRHRTENGSSTVALSSALDDSSDVEADYLLRTRQVVDMSDTLYPKNPAMCSEEARLKSFHNWPAYGLLAPKELASAGLYYTGVGDQVACFCCGGKLKNWEPGDRAWSEHKRHFPKCFFVLGQDVGNVSTESISAELGRSCLNNEQHPRNPSMAEYERRIQTFLTWTYPVNREQLAEAGFYSTDNLLQNQLVQNAIHMGFSLSEIRSIMEKKLQMSGESYTSVEDLVADLISAQKENLKGEPPKESPLEQDLSIEEKLRRLQEEKLCKICMAKDISVVLIPCGHLVA